MEQRYNGVALSNGVVTPLVTMELNSWVKLLADLVLRANNSLNGLLFAKNQPPLNRHSEVNSADIIVE